MLRTGDRPPARPDAATARELLRQVAEDTTATPAMAVRLQPDRMRVYTGTGTPEELCRLATELASNAIPKLPPIQ